MQLQCSTLKFTFLRKPMMVNPYWKVEIVQNSLQSYVSLTFVLKLLTWWIGSVHPGEP